MQATFENSKEFNKLVGVVSAFDSSFLLKGTKAGLRIFCLDASHTSIIEILLPKEYFKTYEYTSKKDQIELGIVVPVFMDIIKGTSKTAVVHLIAQDDKDYLKVQIDEEDSQMVYDMKLMTIEENELQIPEMDFNIRMHLKGSLLKSWKNQICDRTGEQVSFIVHKDKLELESQGSSLSVKSTVCNGENMSVTLFNEPTNLILSPKSIIVASRICDVANEVDFGWTNGAPANFSCSIGTGGKMKMWFAPSINDDDTEMN